MKVPLHVVTARRAKLAAWLQQRSYAPINEVCTRFKVSEATARRDLAALASGKQILRTHGGALADYNHRFPSFNERQRMATEGKQIIARKACKLIQPGDACFFDAGTTVFAIAEELQHSPVTPLTAITNSLPVAELLAPVEGISVHLLGGELLPRQSAIQGRAARMALDSYKIGQSFLSAEGADAEGLWNSQQEVVELQKRLLETSGQSIFCLDATKLGRTAPAFLARWRQVFRFLTDADAETASAAGIPARLLK